MVLFADSDGIQDFKSYSFAILKISETLMNSLILSYLVHHSCLGHK